MKYFYSSLFWKPAGHYVHVCEYFVDCDDHTRQPHKYQPPKKQYWSQIFPFVPSFFAQFYPYYCWEEVAHLHSNQPSQNRNNLLDIWKNDSDYAGDYEDYCGEEVIFFLTELISSNNLSKKCLSKRVIIYWEGDYNAHDVGYYSNKNRIIFIMTWKYFPFQNNWVSVFKLRKIANYANH